MAKTNAPLLSFGGTGTVAKTVVFSKWRGINYARQYVKPSNPNTVAQQSVRKTFALLREMWKIAPPALQQVWNAFAQGRPFTGMNKFVGENVRVLNGQPNMNNFFASPGAKGGLPPVDFVAATGVGAGNITTTFTVPAAPDGWVLVKAVVVAFLDQAPNDFFTGTIVVAEDAAAPYAPELAGLTPGAMYQISGYLVWTKPNGQTAYSVSITDQAAAAV